jgi:hypothetical protein
VARCVRIARWPRLLHDQIHPWQVGERKGENPRRADVASSVRHDRIESQEGTAVIDSFEDGDPLHPRRHDRVQPIAAGQASRPQVACLTCVEPHAIGVVGTHLHE